MTKEMLCKKMNYLASLIDSINDGEINLTEEEISKIEQERESLLNFYFKSFFPENVVPLL